MSASASDADHGKSLVVEGGDELLNLRVTSISGDIVVELSLPSSTTVQELVRCIQQSEGPRTSQERLQLLVDGSLLPLGASLADLNFVCTPGSAEIQLLRHPWHTLHELEADAVGGKYDSCFNFVLVGDSGVGKTSLIDRFAKDIFIDDEDVRWLRPDMQYKSVRVDGRFRVKLTLWDTAGQERFKRPLMASYYRRCDAALVIFDITDRKSWESVLGWLSEVRDSTGNAPMVMVGNKLDLDKFDCRQVSFVEAQSFALIQNLLYFETSAREGTAAEFPFYALLEELLDWQSATPPQLEHEQRDEPSPHRCEVQ